MAVFEVDVFCIDAAGDRTKGAECVSREQDAVSGIKGHHCFRPVYHRSHDKCVGVSADGQGIAFLDNLCTGVDIKREELLDHGDSLGIADDLCVGITENGICQCCAVVGFHMVDDDVIQLASVQQMSQIVEKDAGYSVVDGIKQHRFFSDREIRVVGNPLRDRVYIFKKSQTAVVSADPVKL